MVCLSRRTYAFAVTALLATLGTLCWVAGVGQAAYVIRFVTERNLPIWLYDWHVYAAGAQDLVQGSLYRTPLTYPPHPLPVSDFNLPPLAAAWATPLLVLPDSLAGAVWVAVGALASLGAVWWLVYHYLRLPHGWIWMGAALAIYAQSMTFTIHVLVGNINDLMLGIVALFAVSYRTDRRTLAGVTLGIAAATKLWPTVILVPLVRAGRWHEVLAALGTMSIVMAVVLLWLGTTVVPAMADAVTSTKVNVTLDNPVLWVAWLRERTTWWPEWGAAVVALGLLAIPARGLVAIGLAMLAGLTMIPNLWGHYFPTLAFSVGLIAGALRGSPRARALGERLRRLPMTAFVRVEA